MAGDMRLRAQKWTIVLLIFFGVPALLIWAFMPYLDLSRAAYLTTRHDYSSAISVLNRAIAFNANFQPAYVGRAWIFGKLGQREQALADYAVATRLNSSDWQAYNNRAWLHYEHGDLDDALADANSAVANKEDSAFAHDTRAVILTGKKQYEKALADFNTALQLNGTYGAAYLHRAQLYHQLGDEAAVARDTQKASQLGCEHD